MTELKESQKIQQQFTNACTELGDILFKISILEKDVEKFELKSAELQAKQIELSEQFRLAVEKEKKEEQEQQTKEHFESKAT